MTKEQEQRQEITIEWLQGQAKELSDLKKMIFDLCYTYEDDTGDEYFPDMVIRKIKVIREENKKLKEELKIISEDMEENIEKEVKKRISKYLNKDQYY